MTGRSRNMCIFQLEDRVLSMNASIRDQQYKILQRQISLHQTRIRKMKLCRATHLNGLSGYISMSIVFKSVNTNIFPDVIKIPKPILHLRQKGRTTSKGPSVSSRSTHDPDPDPDPDPDRPLSFGLNIHTTPAAPPPLAI